MRKLCKTGDILYRFLLTALGIYLTFLLLRFPVLSLEYASRGLRLWFDRMIPTLLPFMILSGIMIRMDLTNRCVSLFHPLLRLLYGTSPGGSYTIMMGFLCGFPMGARVTDELVAAGKLTQEEGSRLLAFCNNIGPIYFLSFAAPALGITKPFVPFCIMYGIPLLYGMFVMRPALSGHRFISVFRKRERTQRPFGSQLENSLTAAESTVPAKQPMPLLAAVDASVRSGLIGIAGLGGYMVFFNLLNIAFVPFPNLPPFVTALYRCVLEITGGIDQCGHLYPRLALTLLPFGGFSCIAQTYSMIGHTEISIRPYLFHKLIQTGLTALCYRIFF